MRRHVIYRLLMALMFFVFIGCLVQVIHLMQTQKKEENAFEELHSMIETSDDETQNDGNTSKKNNKNKNKEQESLPSYEKLYKKNSDFIGWLNVQKTNIDYPVMYTPHNEEYYLHRSFDKKYSYSGVPFLGRGSDLDGNNFIIYAHHMKNGTMFADLVKYKEEDYRKKHSQIIFDTVEERRIYEVLAAFATTVSSEEPFRYYEYTGKLNEQKWNEYISGLREKDASMPEISYGERLITLSTCAYHTKEGRFVVVGKLVKTIN